MFALTKKTDYAIIALSHLAKHPDELCTAREIAEHSNMPPALLMNVLKTMNQSRLITSIRGARGGYRLDVPPEEISLSDIITIVEGPIRFVQCAAGSHSAEAVCGLAESCPVAKPVNKVHERLKDFLKTVTLAQIAFDEDYGDPRRECLRMSMAAVPSEPVR